MTKICHLNLNGQNNEIKLDFVVCKNIGVQNYISTFKKLASTLCFTNVDRPNEISLESQHRPFGILFVFRAFNKAENEIGIRFRPKCHFNPHTSDELIKKLLIGFNSELQIYVYIKMCMLHCISRIK